MGKPKDKKKVMKTGSMGDSAKDIAKRAKPPQQPQPQEGTPQ